jgi:hypothetical protein
VLYGSAISPLKSCVEPGEFVIADMPTDFDETESSALFWPAQICPELFDFAHVLEKPMFSCPGHALKVRAFLEARRK